MPFATIRCYVQDDVVSQQFLSRKTRTRPYGRAPSPFVGLAVVSPSDYYTVKPYDYVDVTVSTEDWEIHTYTKYQSVNKLREYHNAQQNDAFIGFSDDQIF